MPFDGQIAPAQADADARWDYRPGRARAIRQVYRPMSDYDVLIRVLLGIKGNWAKRLNTPDGAHCIVGWVTDTCEPTTLIDYNRPQTARLLRRLHDALPKSAQRKWRHHWDTLAAYNDSHSRDAVYRVAERAYYKLIEDMVAEANAQPPAV